MDLLFESPSWIFSALLVMIPSMGISILILWLVRKVFTAEALKKNHDVAGFTFSLVGVLYSVILGFTVINVENRYIKAEETLYQEAMILADLYRESAFFLPGERDAVRKSLRDYVNYIIVEEWNMGESRKMNLGAQDEMDKIWNSYYDISLPDEKTRIWYEESIAQLDNLMNARLTREFSSWEHLGGMMRALLLIGAVITVCFMFFFGLENIKSQMLMTALLSCYLSFMLYLVFSLDHVYKGPEGIKPIALKQVVTLFDHWDKQI